MSRPTTLSNAMAQIDGAFIPEPMEQAALKVLSEAMEAVTWVRGPKLGDNGQREYIAIPDHAIRVTAAVRVIEWRRGKPSAQLTINNNPVKPGGRADTDNLMRIVAKNPDLLRKIMDGYIEGAKQVTPIEVDAAVDAKQSE